MEFLYELKLWTYNKPEIYFLFRKLFLKENGLEFGKLTRIVIEGFPRSANTYSVVVVEEFLKNKVHIAHHLHNPCQIICGLKNNISCYLLIRKPVDAISSYVIRNNVSVRYGLKDYIRFYDTLINYKERLHVIEFEKLINNPRLIVDDLIITQGDIIKKDLGREVDNEEIFTQIEEISVKNFSKLSEKEVARPSEGRQKLKQRVIDEIYSKKYEFLLERANALYKAFTKK
ncbi:hypothetical protein [Reichenbachiella ulvae]|uniref:Sulfotransferase family protein n=1 Tax=Reichenbachiella ulvae TaxID=2980104 RepID=A0ABT3CXQ7_9BACT|nr:hypothetical protein [Reichenbachiella ulvae]MCV9388490.1 hypothetical protein [Reichenbachiella ulvae]